MSNGPIWALLLYVVLAGVGLVGWVLNLVTIFQTCCTPVDGELVLRVVGIFIAPIGSVMGFI